jgi:hypothetical protein
MATLGNVFPANQAMKYYCNNCDYGTSRKSNYDDHILTSKHKRQSFSNLCQPISSKKQQPIKYSCQFCGKEYIDNSGLWRHKKKCNSENNENDNSKLLMQNEPINFDTNVVLDLVKKNQEFQKEMFLEMQKQMFDFMKDKIGDNNSTNIINSHNKTFNLQVFLNEKCKDAMNISDFVESVKLQVSDLENVGKVGYIEGISNIIIKNLKALDVNKRPVHCADQKREVIYVKDDNIWEKEDETNKKLRKAIRMIAHKNICMFKEFRDKYPDCEDYDSKRNSQYNIIVYESMGGKGDNDYEKNSKIIKKIAKNVVIDKSNT